MSDEKPPILMQRRGGFLMPCSPMDAEMVEAFPSGKPLRVRITQPRSLPQHRLYWSMLQKVCENLEQPITTETLHQWIKLRCGVIEPIILRTGEIQEVPGSIAFDQMDQVSFNAFFQRAVDLICEHIIPGLEKPALEREAREMLGHPPDHLSSPAKGDDAANNRVVEAVGG